MDEVEECEGMDHPLFVSCDIHEQLWGDKDDTQDSSEQESESNSSNNGSIESGDDTERLSHSDEQPDLPLWDADRDA